MVTFRKMWKRWWRLFKHLLHRTCTFQVFITKLMFLNILGLLAKNAASYSWRILYFFLSPSFKVFYEMFLYQGSQMVKVRSIKLMLARPVLIRRCLMLFQTLNVETLHQPKSQLCASTLEMNGTTLTMRTCCMPAKPHWPWVQLMRSSSILKRRKYLVEKPRLILFIRKYTL